MAKWRKSSPELVELFAKVLPEDERAERRKMFGHPCSFANGNMFAGLHEENIVLRLPEEDRTVILRVTGVEPFAPMGRAMKEYVIAGPRLRSEPAALRRWVRKAFDYALGLPPKTARKRAAGTARKSRKPRRVNASARA